MDIYIHYSVQPTLIYADNKSQLFGMSVYTRLTTQRSLALADNISILRLTYYFKWYFKQNTTFNVVQNQQILQGENKMAVSEKQRRSQEKYDKENMAILATKAKKEDVDKCKEYAKEIGITPSKFAMLAMKYCIENNIKFEKEE